jgi:flagellar hook assembly protein FlgD
VSVGSGIELPTEFSVFQNYPNPFNPSTTIDITLPVQSDFSLTIFDILGRNVRTYDYQHVPAGVYKVTWDGNNSTGSPAASGVYFYRFSIGQTTITQRMLLLK